MAKSKAKQTEQAENPGPTTELVPMPNGSLDELITAEATINADDIVSLMITEMCDVSAKEQELLQEQLKASEKESAKLHDQKNRLIREEGEAAIEELRTAATELAKTVTGRKGELTDTVINFSEEKMRGTASFDLSAGKKIDTRYDDIEAETGASMTSKISVGFKGSQELGEMLKSLKELSKQQSNLRDAILKWKEQQTEGYIRKQERMLRGRLAEIRVSNTKTGQEMLARLRESSANRVEEIRRQASKLLESK